MNMVKISCLLSWNCDFSVDYMAAIGCLAGAFVAAIAGAILSVIRKFYEKK